MATPKKTDEPRQADAVAELGREELSKLYVGAVARRTRDQLVDGKKVDADKLFPADVIAALSNTGRGIAATLKTQVASGGLVSEDALRKKAGRLGLANVGAAIGHAWRDAADLTDRVDALGKRLVEISDEAGPAGACVVDVTNTGKTRPRVRNGEVFPPGIKIRTRVANRAEWLRLKGCKHLDIEVVEGNPPDPTAILNAG